ncbi:MAG: acylphosphatase [Beijerinckiaceae bacterium]|nr:acylphosphatase [Beijerinckiaceae bacterium]MDO9440482.1 acylphosphatase [Beijerinckiaceae bacterium]
MTEMLVVHVRVEGHVQGVGFRAWTAREARGRSVRGFVRNRRDGSVEAVFSGDADDVAALAEACGRGPASARVLRVDVRPATDSDCALFDASRFEVLPTG